MPCIPRARTLQRCCARLLNWRSRPHNPRMWRGVWMHRRAPAELESVFVKFRQVDAASRGTVGLGLGLYISKCILEGHHGRIWAENPPNGGGLFRFTLPAG